MGRLIGVDIGGTFTDCVVVDSDGRAAPGKAATTPSDYAQGIFDAVDSAARRASVEPDAIWQDGDRFVHGTTIGTNAIVERTGAKCGLLTTIGHEDVLYIGRGRSAVGIPEAELTWHSKHYKPRPIVPKRLTRGVVARMDSSGKEVVPLDREQARQAIQELLDQGVEAIAIGFLWAFKNPAHERETHDLIRELAPHLFVTLSSDIAPKWGEFERINATVLNSYLGPKTVDYLDGVSGRLDAIGFEGGTGLMQCAGGYVPISEAADAPLTTLDSGPVAGVIASRTLAGNIGVDNVIATDMGGTSFDAGIIVDGEALTRDKGLTDRFEYQIVRVDITSIGSGGGSIVTLDPVTRTLQVGPRSAGAVPGPVCYGRGGSEPTVTDADVLLGMVNPDEFLGGESRLDVEAARGAIERLAEPLGMSAIECAAGIQRIVETQMAEALRRVSVESGLDPRDFWIFAYGGAGPVHAAAYSRELGAKGVVVPQGDFASVWSAWGAAGADVVRVHEQAFVTGEPLPADDIRETYANLERQALESVVRTGFEESDVMLQRSAKMKWRLQVFEVDVPVLAGELTEESMPQIIDAFAERYEMLFGRNTAYRDAGVEITELAVTARGLNRVELVESAEVRAQTPADDALRPSRGVYWWELDEKMDTAVFDGSHLRPGDAFEGPAIVESPDTSVVVRPRHQGRIDTYGNVLIDLDRGGAA